MALRVMDRLRGGNFTSCLGRIFLYPPVVITMFADMPIVKSHLAQLPVEQSMSGR